MMNVSWWGEGEDVATTRSFCQLVAKLWPGKIPVQARSFSTGSVRTNSVIHSVVHHTDNNPHSY